jgi:signal transduction histidine kinase
MKALRKTLEIVAIIAAVVVLLSSAAALCFVNLKVAFTVDAMAEEYRQRVEVFELERARVNHVLGRIEAHLKQWDTKHGRPIGPRK